MTEQEKRDRDLILGAYAFQISSWLEEQKDQKVATLIMTYKEKKETQHALAELSVLTDLIGSIRTKRQAYEGKKERK